MPLKKIGMKRVLAQIRIQNVVFPAMARSFAKIWLLNLVLKGIWNGEKSGSSKYFEELFGSSTDIQIDNIGYYMALMGNHHMLPQSNIFPGC